MKISRLFLIFAFCCTSHTAFSNEGPAETRVPAAEGFAKTYMTAFFHGDLEIAASLTDTMVLRTMQSSILGQLGEEDNTENRPTPAALGLPHSFEHLKSLSGEELYVAVLSANRKAEPQFAEAMKLTEVEVLGSEPSSEGTVIVQLRITTVPGQTDSSKITGLRLRETKNGWKVLGNTP